MKFGKRVAALACAGVLCLSLTACSEMNGQDQEIHNTYEAGNTLMKNQPTPTDLEYSLERYNLVRRAYWNKPLSYIVLFTDSGAVVGRFTVDGKISSLNSFLSPDSENYESPNYTNEWLPDVDGSFGENDGGVFFFTTDGKYMEWNGTYLYSDIPFEITTPTIVIGGEGNG